MACLLVIMFCGFHVSFKIIIINKLDIYNMLYILVKTSSKALIILK